MKEKKREIRRRKEEVLCCVVNESFATSVFFGTSCVSFFSTDSPKIGKWLLKRPHFWLFRFDSSFIILNFSNKYSILFQ